MRLVTILIFAEIPQRETLMARCCKKFRLTIHSKSIIDKYHTKNNFKEVKKKLQYVYMCEEYTFPYCLQQLQAV